MSRKIEQASLDRILVNRLIEDKYVKRFVCMVYGNSMEPFISDGAKIVFVKKPVEQIKIGEVVLFCKKNKYLVHRVLWKRKSYDEMELYIKGDASWFADRWIAGKDIFAVAKEIKRKKNTYLQYIPGFLVAVYSFLFLIVRRFLNLLVNLNKFNKPSKSL